MNDTGIHRGIISPEKVYKLPEPVMVELGGKMVTCSEFIQTEKYGNVPILDIKLMSGEKELELIKRQKELHPELYAEYYAERQKG